MKDEWYATGGEGWTNLPEAALELLKRIDPDQQCPTCKGTSVLYALHQEGEDPMGLRQYPCPTCKGSGLKTKQGPGLPTFKEWCAERNLTTDEGAQVILDRMIDAKSATLVNQELAKIKRYSDGNEEDLPR